MSLAYLQLRQSRLAMHQARERAHFEASCTLLQEYGARFWSAEAMARLGRRTLREMDKATSNAENRRRKRPRNSDRLSHADVSLRHSHDQATDHCQKLRRTDISGETFQAPLARIQPGSTQQTDSPTQIESDGNASFSPVPLSSGTDISDVDILSQWDANVNFENIDAIFGGQLDLSFPTNFDELLMMGDAAST